MDSDDILAIVLGRSLQTGTMRVLAGLAALSVVAGTLAYLIGG